MRDVQKCFSVIIGISVNEYNDFKFVINIGIKTF